MMDITINERKKLKRYKKFWKNKFKSKIDTKKNTIKPKEFLDEEIVKDRLREKRRLRKEDAKRRRIY